MDASAVTLLLARVEEGDETATDELYRVAYDDLHARAGKMIGAGADNTLQATALVHEAWLRLRGAGGDGLASRAHFLGVAAKAMRSVLIDHARSKHAQKRGGGAHKLLLDEALVAYEERAIDVVALNEALEQLQQLDERKARIVELRFFGGLSNDEVAAVLGVSVATVERGWTTARAWLRGQLGDAPGPGGDHRP
ncbi:MAG: sigma-70 family RNA polymerase sigma factor [bacterium]|nr:sigma-70 family RNA polymerase sigma factor [bacterium]